jgi:hypothetical protein
VSDDHPDVERARRIFGAVILGIYAAAVLALIIAVLIQ